MIYVMSGIHGCYDLYREILTALHILDGEKCSREFVEVYKMWLSDGGEKTLKEYLMLPAEEQEKRCGVWYGLGAFT